MPFTSAAHAALAALGAPACPATPRRRRSEIRLRPRVLAVVAAVVAVLAVAACSPAAEPVVSYDPNAPSVTAKGTQFDKTEIDVPSDTGFDLVLHNEDSVQHNVSIYSDEAHSQRVFGGDFANSGTHVYHVQALAPGTYYFQCDIHPSMHGVILAAAG